jgi:hypothetical protein
VLSGQHRRSAVCADGVGASFADRPDDGENDDQDDGVNDTHHGV